MIQHEVAECTIEWYSENDLSRVTVLPTSVVALDRDVRSILHRQNICVATHSSQDAAPNTEIIVSELQSLSASPATPNTCGGGLGGTSSIPQTSLIEEMEALHVSTLLATYVVLEYLQLWKQQSRYKTIEICIGATQNILNFFVLCIFSFYMLQELPSRNLFIYRRR